MKTQRCRATVVRRCAMPKANGTDRPLGMPALEDTLGPLVCATRCTAISAQDFLAGSDGSRPGRGALEAVCGIVVSAGAGGAGAGAASGAAGAGAGGGAATSPVVLSVVVLVVIAAVADTVVKPTSLRSITSPLRFLARTTIL